MIIQLLDHHHRKIQFVFWLTIAAVVGLSLWPNAFYSVSVHYSDKVGHLLAYFTLGVLLVFGWRLRTMRATLIALVLLFVLGGAIELIQGLPMIKRTTSALDLLANSMGAMLGLLSGAWVRGR